MHTQTANKPGVHLRKAKRGHKCLSVVARGGRGTNLLSSPLSLMNTHGLFFTLLAFTYFTGTQDRTLYLPGKLYTTKRGPSLLLPHINYKVSEDKHKHRIVISLAHKRTKADVTLAFSSQGATATHCLPHAQMLPNKNLLLR